MELKDLEEFGSLMPIEEFSEYVETRCFIDDDGWGYLATTEKRSDILVIPSDFEELEIDPMFTHVKWFNS